jgi:hypothetical protein
MVNEILELEKEEARDILWGDHPDGKVIEDKITGNSRWSIEHDIVIEYKGKFYIGFYTVGATEQQDEQAWEYDDTVKFYPAKQVEKRILVWEEA